MGKRGLSPKRPPAFSAEFRLLCLCCAGRDVAARAQAMQALVTVRFDWAIFRQLVERHRVAGLVFQALQAAEIKPARDVASALALAALQIRRDNQASAAEAVRIQARLEAEGIEAIFFKGAVLGQLAYGALDIKHSKDIDILVAPAHAQRLVALLEEDGYRLWLPALRLDARHWPALLRFGKEVAMVRPGTALQVEPHWRLAGNPRLLAGLDVTADSERVVLPGHGALRSFGRADSFAYLCVHGMEHAWFRLKWLADLHALIAEAPSEEIEALYRHAERLGVGASAATALALCERLLGYPAPVTLRGILRSSRVLRRLETLSLSAMHDPSAAYRFRRNFEFNALVAHAQGYLAAQLLLAWFASEDAVHFPLPRGLYALYPVLRIPFGLARRARGLSYADRYPMPPIEAAASAPSAS